MATEIIINKHPLQVKQYNGQMVVTFKDIDLCHGRPEGTASRNFRVNKQHFIEGTDYFSVTPDKFQLDEIRRFGISSPKGGILITESGYYMIVKSFTDELSWAVQRELVNSYFKYKEETMALVPQKPYEYFDKTWKGEPVLTLEDAEHITGIKSTTLGAFLRKYAMLRLDYKVLAKGDLQAFKAENPSVSRSVSHVLLVTVKGVKEICRFYGLGIDEPKQFAVKKINDQLTFPDVSEDNPSKMLKQIKAARNKTTTINTLLERLEEMIAYKNGSETEKFLYDYYVPAYIRILGSFQVHIGRN